MFAKQTSGLDSGAVRTLAEAAISTGQAKLEQLKVTDELEGNTKASGNNLRKMQKAESKARTDYERIRTASLDKVTKITEEIDHTKRDDLYLDMLNAVTGGRWR
ncbi:hypothetical protein [Shimazuella alba]|uniref:Uncharacterized protein n=1 Tax=Shimazuella alba TaxID=2690964 RepID=A0A6I4VXX1_9BACL|nr:hypothetical protein [Shimazuella alba]MXQ54750.1 hypothetical protein [Shimazuella alba]